MRNTATAQVPKVRRIRRKPFDPKPMEAGAQITWTQFHLDGSKTERTGTVLDRAPSISGAKVVSWVMPDVRLDTDLYWAIMVGKATSGYQSVHGRDVSRNMLPSANAYVHVGDLHASDDPKSPTGVFFEAVNNAIAA